MSDVTEKRLKRLRIFYFVFGIPALVFGFLALLVLVCIYDPYKSFSLGEGIELLYGIGYLLAGILFFATYYGLKTRKIFTKFTGLIGCILLISSTILMTILITSIASLFYHALFLIVAIVLMASTIILWDDIPSEEHMRVSPKKKMLLVALVCIFITFTTTYSWVNSYKDQEMLDFLFDLTKSMDDYCDDAVDGFRFLGYWSRTETNDSFSYEFLYNRTFNASLSNQTDSANYSGTFRIENSMLCLTINGSSSSYEYTFNSDDTIVTIDGMEFTRQKKE